MDGSETTVTAGQSHFTRASGDMESIPLVATAAVQDGAVPASPIEASSRSALDLAPIKAREQAAAKGPWKRIKSVGDTYEVATPSGYAVAGDDVGLHICDAEFIASARQDIPALIAEIESLRAAKESSE